jgi:hypothetical protein
MNTFKINNRLNTENTMNLSNRSRDKELFTGELSSEENKLEYDIENKYSLYEIDFLSKERKNYRIIDELDNNEDIEILKFFYNIVLILFIIVALNTYFVIKN